MSMIFGKKKKDLPGSPNSSKVKPPAIRTDVGGAFSPPLSTKSHQRSSKKNSGTAGVGGGESLLSNLSPKSYAQQFDALDQVVALATPTPKTQGVQNSSILNNDAWIKTKEQKEGREGADELAKNLDGLTLGGNQSNVLKSGKGLAAAPSSLLRSGKSGGGGNGGVAGSGANVLSSQGAASDAVTDTLLDFDDEPNDVFEDDDGAVDTGDDSNHGSDNVSAGNKKAGRTWTPSTLSRNKKTPPPNTRSSNDRSRSMTQEKRRGGSNHAASHPSSRSASVARTDDGREAGTSVSSASSSSSRMGENYDNASVGTTESENEECAVEGKVGSAKPSGGHGSDSAEDYTDDEDEGEDGYKPGGYHPVKVGEVYNQR